MCPKPNMAPCWTDTRRTGREVTHLRPGAGRAGRAGLSGPRASPSLAALPTLAGALRRCEPRSQAPQGPPAPPSAALVASCGLFLTPLLHGAIGGVVKGVGHWAVLLVSPSLGPPASLGRSCRTPQVCSCGAPLGGHRGARVQWADACPGHRPTVRVSEPLRRHAENSGAGACGPGRQWAWPLP